MYASTTLIQFSHVAPCGHGCHPHPAQDGHVISKSFQLSFNENVYKIAPELFLKFILRFHGRFSVQFTVFELESYLHNFPLFIVP
jgi:hypothetical protein